MSLSRIFLPLVLLLGAPLAHAQMAVFDAATAVQLIMQVRTLEQQLTTARAQLLQAQSLAQSMTGSRGMQGLLGNLVRNYLPADFRSLQRAGSSTSYGALSADLQSALSALSILSQSQLSGLSTAGSGTIYSRRQSIALQQAIARQALAHSSSNFNSLQQLIDAIGTARDSKASMDLQARIAAEQGMLQNEQTKLQVLYQGALAEQWAGEQRVREQVIAAHGRFDSRFQPVP